MTIRRLDAIALTLIKTSQLVIDFAEIVELDINPLLADEYSEIALDARIRMAPASRPGTERLAIRPHPKDMENKSISKTAAPCCRGRSYPRMNPRCIKLSPRLHRGRP